MLIRSTAGAKGAKFEIECLRGLDGSPLDLFRKFAANAKLSRRGELHVDVAVGRVLDVFLDIELHDRESARLADGICTGDGHLVECVALPFAFLLSSLRSGLAAPEGSCSSGDDGCRNAILGRYVQKIAALHGCQGFPVSAMS